MYATSYYPDPLGVRRSQIEGDERFRMRVVSDRDAVWQAMAGDFCSLLARNEAAGRPACVILSPRWLDLRALADRLNAEKLSCKRLTVFHPEEFCDECGHRVSEDHPLSLTGRVRRQLYGRLDADLRPPRQNIVFPDPERPGEFGVRLDDAGGAQACYAALGMDANFGFHTPPGAGEPDDDGYFDLPARVVRLSPAALQAIALEFACAVASVPPMAVCEGLGDIVRSAGIRLYLAHRWQSAVLRRVFYGPVTACYPASILQRHPEVAVTMAPEVADSPSEL